MHRDRPSPKPVWQLLLASSLLILVVTPASIPSAFAQTRRYVPPQEGEPPTSTGIGGARTGSCTGATEAAFTALAPDSHVGQTAATRPTFVWYVPDSQPLMIDFRLYAYGADGRIQRPAVYRTELSSTPGIMKFILPQTEPELSVGQRYHWQAALICDPNHGSEDAIINAEIQIVENTLPDSERWYDLLTDALNSSTAHTQSISSLLLELAALEKSSGEDLATTAIAAPEDQRTDLLIRSQEVLQHGQNLTQIANTEP